MESFGRSLSDLNRFQGCRLKPIRGPCFHHPHSLGKRNLHRILRSPPYPLPPPHWSPKVDRQLTLIMVHMPPGVHCHTVRLCMYEQRCNRSFSPPWKLPPPGLPHQACLHGTLFRDLFGQRSERKCMCSEKTSFVIVIWRAIIGGPSPAQTGLPIIV